MRRTSAFGTNLDPSPSTVSCQKADGPGPTLSGRRSVSKFKFWYVAALSRCGHASDLSVRLTRALAVLHCRLTLSPDQLLALGSAGSELGSSWIVRPIDGQLTAPFSCACQLCSRSRADPTCLRSPARARGSVRRWSSSPRPFGQSCLRARPGGLTVAPRRHLHQPWPPGAVPLGKADDCHRTDEQRACDWCSPMR